MNITTDRRSFIHATSVTVLTAAAYSRVLGANERVALGLIGYGLIIGLNGTGDTLNNSPFTQQSIIAMLERLGVNTRDIAGSLRTRNVAAVMVTATLPAFARQGSPSRFNLALREKRGVAMKPSGEVGIATRRPPRTM